jgi:metallophosphoesterase (TIGR00282 family)
MRVLCIGDIVGKPGRQTVRQLLPGLIAHHGLDLVIANAENAAAGMGLTVETARELLALPIDLLTGGNHIWKFKDIYPLLDTEPRVIRPLNYPEGAPGNGLALIPREDGPPVGVVNLLGRIFMEPVGCPFAAAEAAIAQLRAETPVILVEIHAEATSEKRALGWFLDGRVSAVYGTHTHVATADEEVLPGGTGYITDIGMTGPHCSVIGMKKELMIERMRSLRPVGFDVAKEDLRLSGVILDIDTRSGKTRSVTRVQQTLQV